ncbi:MAG: aminotransferase class I/II-fold pyridoxal phosphate-dependent enzyme [Chloroflexi bacterium]|jgi:LL-diaminopimelate aminotransferase|nr:aminotransferase class I/II-fold pyridoxal phosphate-dependent enzyme [Chloroflexota bacterium]
MTNPTDKLSPNYFATLSARVAELCAAGYDVIRLDIGSPDLPPAAHIVEALTRSARDSTSHGYQPLSGSSEIRRAWAQLYQNQHGVKLNPDDLLPLLGSKEGVFHLSLAILNPEDVVLVPDPGYQTYAQGARFAGAEPVNFPLLPENGFLPDLDAIPAEIACRAKLMWLNYPNNPTAAVANLEFFARAVQFARRNQILLVHDAAYTQITFDGWRAPSILEVPGAADVAVELNTLSKSHNMAGWRLGVAAGNRVAIGALRKLKTHADSGHFLPIQEGAVAALTGDQGWLAKRNAVYQARRDVTMNALQSVGLQPHASKASLYIWCPIPEGWRSMDFALHILNTAHVSVTPGTIFGPRGEGYFRLSLVQPEEVIEAAMQRMKNLLKVAC